MNLFKTRNPKVQADCFSLYRRIRTAGGEGVLIRHTARKRWHRAAVRLNEVGLVCLIYGPVNAAAAQLWRRRAGDVIDRWNQFDLAVVAVGAKA